LARFTCQQVHSPPVAEGCAALEAVWQKPHWV
jgi:hypothetical protein